MTERFAGSSPRTLARVAGLLYLINIIGGIFAEIFVRSAVIVSGDAAATARNILAHELRFRAGFAVGIVVVLTNVPLAVIFFDLFKVVSRRAALFVVYITLVPTAIEAVNLLLHFAPLILLKGGPWLSGFSAEQLQSLAYASLRLQSTGFDLALSFFAFYCMAIGWLIFRSTFLPRALGVLMALGGVSYLVNAFAGFLFPAFRATLLPWVLIPPGIGEISLCLWLLVMAVNVRRWDEIAALGRAADR